MLYVSAPDIRKSIEYDLEQERSFDYSKVDRNGLVNHIAQFGMIYSPNIRGTFAMPWYEPTTRMYKRALCVIPNI